MSPAHESVDYSREKYYQWNEDDSSHWIDAPTPPMGGELAPGIKQIKPADDPPLSAVGSNVYDSTITLPKDWTITLPPKVDIVEDWAEYHAQYSLKDGALHVLRTLIIKKNHVPLDDWDKYLAFRRAMFEDENHQSLLAPPSQDKHKRHLFGK